MMNNTSEILMKPCRFPFPRVAQVALMLLFGTGAVASAADAQEPKQASAKVAESARKPVVGPAPAPPRTISQAEFFGAALNGNLDVVKQAIRAGADVNQRDEARRTVLHLAAFNGHTYIVDHLVEAGAVVDARDQLNRTALMFAATGASVDTLSVLLAAGANVNLKDGHENWTPLMFAAAEGNRDVVELLLANKADPTAHDVDGETSAHFAHQRGHAELAALLERAEKHWK